MSTLSRLTGSTPVELGFVITRYTPMAPTLVRESFHRAGSIYEQIWSAAPASITPAASETSRRPSRSCRRARSCSTAKMAIYDEQLRSPFDWLRGPDRDAVA